MMKEALKKTRFEGDGLGIIWLAVGCFFFARLKELFLFTRFFFG